jgi:hypothetical protein
MKRIDEAKIAHLISMNSLRLPFRNDLICFRKAWHMGRWAFIVYLYILGVPQGSALVTLIWIFSFGSIYRKCKTS